MKNTYTDPFQAIADQSRRQILHLLAKDEQSINSLALNFKMSRPAVSKHIKILYSAGFITIEDKGRERLCALNKHGFKELQSWINFFDTFWTTRLDALGAFLEKSQPKKSKITKK
ncbi:transcriptional regulator [Sphingobacteriaceae bacterium]|nr:transcriptional regulator [Sphingobacteriaceae bacterium]